jgi:hypothetical protein
MSVTRVTSVAGSDLSRCRCSRLRAGYRPLALLTVRARSELLTRAIHRHTASGRRSRALRSRLVACRCGTLACESACAVGGFVRYLELSSISFVPRVTVVVAGASLPCQRRRRAFVRTPDAVLTCENRNCHCIVRATSRPHASTSNTRFRHRSRAGVTPIRSPSMLRVCTPLSLAAGRMTTSRACQHTDDACQDADRKNTRTQERKKIAGREEEGRGGRSGRGGRGGREVGRRPRRRRRRR